MSAREVRPGDALDTYRYLRLGILSAVVLLGASIGLEAVKAGCLQNSVSAYYYTPTRAIFVGSMFVVGLALIVYQGRGTKEDMFLNLAGAFATVVAVAPTTDVGLCYSVPPNPLPLQGDSLAHWVRTNIDNNMRSLLIAGAVGLILVFFLWLKTRHDSPTGARTWALRMLGTALLLSFVWWLLEGWRDFDTKAHGYAAILMFVCLGAAIYFNSKEPGHKPRLPAMYLAIAGLMAAGILIPLLGLFGEHEVFALEAYEILLFAIYWLVQTVENWREERIAEAASS